jgi:cation diffusion facilitator CzcD-associated flavoprotein CzcO
VPSHSYQLSFEPNTQWSEFYAQGHEIRQYYENVARKYGVDKHLKLCTTVTKAAWIPDKSQWQVDVKENDTNSAYTVYADFLVSATGRLNNAKLPDIPGLDRFAGTVMHTGRWDKSITLENKRVAVIGNGASGMQIVTALLPRVKHLVHFARTRNWVSPAFNNGLTALAAKNGHPGGHTFSEEQRKAFEQDPAAYLEYRRGLDATFHRGLAAMYLGSEANAQLRAELTALMSDRVDHDEELLKRLIPEYAPICKRLTPAPGYLEALRNPKVDYVTEPISEVQADGLVTRDYVRHEVDVIITATGFPDSSIPAFPVIGRDGQNIQEVWGEGGSIGYPRSYFGVMAPNFPNYFFVLQTQGTAFGGTVPQQCEQTATYIAQCIRKIQAQSYAALEPKEEATRDFDAVVEGFFSNKTTTDSCSSWWKQGSGPSRVLIAWPGTGHHKWDISRSPRWEDFSFERRKGAEENLFHYFGSGVTVKEERGRLETVTAYLSEVGKADLSTLHESWTQGY